MRVSNADFLCTTRCELITSARSAESTDQTIRIAKLYRRTGNRLLREKPAPSFQVYPFRLSWIPHVGPRSSETGLQPCDESGGGVVPRWNAGDVEQRLHRELTDCLNDPANLSVLVGNIYASTTGNKSLLGTLRMWELSILDASLGVKRCSNSCFGWQF
jgi:hypothetical protein